MARKVLCAVKGLQEAIDTARVAGGLARDLGWELILVHVYDEPVQYHGMIGAPSIDVDREARQRANEVLVHAEGAVPEDTVVRRRVTTGLPYKKLAEVVADEDAGLLVVGSRRGSLFSSLLPSRTARGVLQESPCPVVIVPAPAGGGPIDDTDRAALDDLSVVSGVDGSERSIAAARLGADLASRLGHRFVVVHAYHDPEPVVPPAPGPVGVWPPRDAERAREQAIEVLDKALSALPPPDVTRAEPGPPAMALESVAGEEHGRLLVVGTRGLGRLRSALLGSVSNDLLTTARRPVVVLPEDVEISPGSDHYELEQAVA